MEMQSYLATRLQYQHKALIDIIDGLSDELIRKQLIPCKWSIFENIVHLQTYQHVFCARMKKILEENNPSFPRYVADTDPDFLENCRKTTSDILIDLISTRREMSTARLLNKKDLERMGNHPVFGALSLEQWLNFFVLHESHHIFTVFKMAAELRKGQESKGEKEIKE